MKIVASKTAPRQTRQQTNAWQALGDNVAAAVTATLSDPAAWSGEPDELREAIDEGLRQGLEMALQSAAERWGRDVLGAERYERTCGRAGYRSGTRSHRFAFKVGPVTIEVPKPRQGPSRPFWVPALKRAPDALMSFARNLWLRGLSDRDLAAVSEELAGRRYSHTTIGKWVRDVADDVLRWLNRPVREDVRYLVLDALYVPVVRESANKEPILVALGITRDGIKEVLDVLPAPSESADSWGTILSRLKLRGLPVEKLELVVTDGDEGLLAALETHLPGARRQRCTVHKVRNIVGRCPRDLKKTAPREAAEIFKAPSRSEARRRASAFIERYEHSHPRLAAVIRDDLDAALAFYDLDASLWESLRSTNALERLHRELRRKFREVGAMKAELNTTRIAVQVAGFVNEEMKDKPIAGFRKRNRRGRQR